MQFVVSLIGVKGSSVTTALSEATTRALEERLIAWLTTLRSDGSPHTTPAWFIFDETFIWIASGQRNRKVANILGDPRVSIAIDGSAPSPLVAQGRATIIGMADVPQFVLDGLASKYDGWDARDNSIDGGRVLLKISIDRWLLGA